jgi:hypothetical protein
MLIANTVISGIQAGTQLYSVIDSLAKQKENGVVNKARNELEEQIAKDVVSGKTSMTTENGQIKYTGLSDEAKAIYEKYKNLIETDMGGLKRGNAGRAKESLDQLYSDLNVGAAKMISDKAHKDLHNEFEMNRQNGVQEAIKTGSRSLLEQTLSDAKGWMSEEVWNQYSQKSEREIYVGGVENHAIKLAQTEGMDAVLKFLDITDLMETQKSSILSEAQQRSNQTVDTAKVSAADTYTKIKQNDGTIRQAYDAAVTQDFPNPETLEARKTVARQKQFYDLNERFYNETDGATLAQLEALRGKYKDGGTYDADYYGQEELQNRHYSAISESIDKIYSEVRRAEEKTLAEQEKAETKAEKDAEKKAKEDSAAILDTVRNEYTQWQQGKRDGRPMWHMIEVFKDHIPYDERRRMEHDLIAGIDGSGTDAAWHYDRLEAILEAYAPDKKTASIAEIDAYNQRVRQMKESIMEKRFRGVSEDIIKKEIDNILEVEISQILRDAVSKADIGSSGLGGGAQKTVKEYLWFANQGKLDIYFGERSTTELSFDEEGNVTGGIIPLTIGGDNMTTVYAQVNSFSKDYLNNELGKANITVGEGQMMPGKDDAQGGNFRHKGSDGNWYRLNVKSRNGDFIIEKLEAGEWVNVDLRKLPGYSPGSPGDSPGIPESPAYYNSRQPAYVPENRSLPPAYYNSRQSAYNQGGR